VQNFKHRGWCADFKTPAFARFAAMKIGTTARTAFWFNEL
jgi:hypothetical protein